MADTKISALTAVGTAAGTDEFPVNQGGVSKKETLDQVAAYARTGVVPVLADPGTAWASSTAYSAGDRIAVDLGHLREYVYEATINGTTDSVEPTWDSLGRPLFEVADGTLAWNLLGPVGAPEGFASWGAGIVIKEDNQQVILGGEDVVAQPIEAFRVEAGEAVVIGAGAQLELTGTTYALMSAGTAYFQASGSDVSLGGDITHEAATATVKHLAGTADPSSGGGVAANVGSIYLRNVGGTDTTGEVWAKTGAADTAWTQVTSSSTSPTAPTVASVGTAFSGTGVPTATVPSHQADDILLLIIQSANDSQVAAPAGGWKQLGPQNGIGAAAAAGSTKLSLFWLRASSGATAAPTIPDTGDHTYGVILAIRGCVTTGDPFSLGQQSWAFTAGTSGTSVGFTTTVDNALVMMVAAHGIDSASAQASSIANSSLSSVTEQFDGATTDGTGGGILVATGIDAVAGDFGAFTWTWGSSTVEVDTTIVWLPADAGPIVKPTEKQSFIGSRADLDDTYVQPSGARHIFAQIIDGGGGGSGGNTTTTAAGGGGGGGGGYAEAHYRPQDLSATVSLHAGAGGAAGTALNQAGNAGAISEFDKAGGRSPLSGNFRRAGTAATAAASADGGNGGCGSGFGTTSPAVGTRIDITAATAGAAIAGTGGRGGNGSTSPVGGSPAVMGGGGGESGADTDAGTSAGNNGWSIYGGGGGAGGRTNTNISIGGHGGGVTQAASAQGQAGTDSLKLPYGGAGGNGGGSSVVTGGSGGFPGGGGGGGAGVAGGFGGAGGHGMVVVTTDF